MTEWSDVPALVEGLREPTELKRLLRQRVQEAHAELRRERGEVTRPEDTYDMQRRLGQALDLFGGYATAFKDITALIKQLIEEELVDAVGESDGVPNQGITVPDAEGDVRLSLDMGNKHVIDEAQVMTVVGHHLAEAIMPALVDMFAEASAIGENAHKSNVAQMGEAIGVVLQRAKHNLTVLVTATWQTLALDLGKVELQVSKVKAYANGIARRGDDQGAAVVNSAITTTQSYKGVKFERKGPT